MYVVFFPIYTVFHISLMILFCLGHPPPTSSFIEKEGKNE